MPTTQPALRAYTARHSGVRARGRPRRRWIDGVAETLSAHGIGHSGRPHTWQWNVDYISTRRPTRHKRKDKVSKYNRIQHGVVWQSSTRCTLAWIVLKVR
ncbi:hypothetical protein Bbelb_142890 [Branchiostoma belcheri]|nr:hypothetical protein Bbelb_142890 [Branchiostoma belcheri]